MELSKDVVVDTVWITSLISLTLIVIIFFVEVLTRRGALTIESIGVLTNTILTIMLVVLYSRQNKIQERQQEISAAQYKPLVRPIDVEIDQECRKVRASLINSGNSSAMDMGMRVDIYLNTGSSKSDSFVPVDKIYFTTASGNAQKIIPRHAPLTKTVVQDHDHFLNKLTSGDMLEVTNEETLFTGTTTIALDNNGKKSYVSSLELLLQIIDINDGTQIRTFATTTYTDLSNEIHTICLKRSTWEKTTNANGRPELSSIPISPRLPNEVIERAEEDYNERGLLRGS